MPITASQLRTLVLDSLLRASLIGEHFYQIVAALAVERGLLIATTSSSRYGGIPAPRLTQAEDLLVNDIFYDLLVEGIVRPGLGSDQPQLPHYHLTEFGKEILAGRTPSPFDPDGFLTSIKREIPRVDDVINTYLTESLRTFRIGCYLASTVTLGTAAEKAILLLIEACADALPAAAGDAFRKKTEGRQIKNQFGEFHKMLIGKIRGQLPKDIDDLLDVELAGIFDIIRNQRNSAGHPTGNVISQRDANANLYAFPAFLKKVYDLIDWLKANPL